jgi:hypothetical protein
VHPVIRRLEAADWLFIGSDKGGQAAAVLSSFTATCKAHGIDPFMYLRDVLGRICAQPEKHLEKLLRDPWLACLAPPTQLPASAA